MRVVIATQYIEARSVLDDPFAVIALASTRRDVRALNAAIRISLRATGCLGADDQTITGRDGHDLTLAVGDLVLVTRNDNHRGLLNGTRGHVTHVDSRGVELAVDDGRTMRLPTSWAADRLTHAYALTLHKAQGLTVDIALIDTTGLPDRNAGYVALSRARTRTELHVCDPDALNDAMSDDPFERAPANHLDPVIDLQARLRDVHEQQLAITQLPEQHNLGRARGIAR